VAIFFALSGFVLMLPYLNLRDTDDSSRKESCAYIRPCGRS
jgi:peptidoglycan/LPS O-acetylase OafA/YrhL